MNPERIVIGTRGSDLALWQARYVAELLKSIAIEPHIQIIKTKGDNIQHLGFDKIEGKGFFTSELEEALLTGTIDLAVHSYKDLPTTQPEGLLVAAVTERASPLDVLVIRKERKDALLRFGLPKNATVGTSSARRKSQMLWLRPDIVVEDLRGNVPTRMARLLEKKYDAIVLAKAGIDRLNLRHQDLEYLELPPLYMVPAPAQGALALQTRSDHKTLVNALQKIHRPEVAIRIEAEREMLTYFDGGCQLPLGSFCTKENEQYALTVSYSSNKEKFPVRVKVSGTLVNELAGKAFALIQRIKASQVFITADAGRYDLVTASLKSNDFMVEQASCIETRALPKIQLPDAEWIYFSSPAGVKHFATVYPEVMAGKKLACAGSGTTEALANAGIQADYSGDERSPVEAASFFAEKYQPESILLPVSLITRGTARTVLREKARVFEWPLYETLPKKVRQEKSPDILVITSPSQAASYFSQYPYAGVCKYIALGKSTAEAMLPFVPEGAVSLAECNHQISLLETIYLLSTND